MRTIFDALIISLSWISSYFIRQWLKDVFGYPIQEIKPYVISLPIIVVIFLLVSSGMETKRKKKKIDELIITIRVWSIGVLITTSVSFFLRELQIARSVITIFSIISFFLITISHYITKEEKEKILIYGINTTSMRILQKLEDIFPNFDVVGFLGDKKEDIGKNIEGYKVLGTLGDMRDIVKGKGATKVIISNPNLPRDAIMDIIVRNEDLKTSFLIASPDFISLSRGFDVEFVGNIPLVEIDFPKKSFLYEMTKRIMDIIVSIFAIILTFPIWIFAAIAIKLTSPGPVFFVQERIGKNGKPFKIIKFRTMYITAPKYELSPSSPYDPRITPVGKFLRRWSLDELPQFINVLKGEMSVVGPRPEMPQIVQNYKPWERKRLDVKPGITGLWQVIGRKELRLETNIHYDLIYVKNRSILLDIAIILKTIPAIFSRRGAY